MNKDFATMKTNIGNAVRDTSSAFASLIGVYINRRHRRVMNTLIQEDVWPLHRTLTIPTTDGTKTYSLSFDFEDMVSLHDDTNDQLLEQIDEREFQQLFGSNPDAKGQPLWYRPYSDGMVDTQPTSASILALVSDIASDTTQTVRIRGLSGGVEKAEDVTLNGTTSMNSANSYTEVFQVSKSATSTGKVTITANSGAVTIAAIPPSALHARYQRVRLHYVPAGTYTLTGTYKRRILPLVSDYDYCALEEVEDIVELFAEADAWRSKRQFAKAAAMIQDANGQLADLVFRNVAKGDKSHQFAVTPYPRDEA